MKTARKLKSFKQYYQEKTKNDPNLQIEVEIGRVRIQIAHHIIKAREAMNMTQERLADHLGVTQQSVSKIEKGSNNTTLDTLLRILSVLGIALKVHVAKAKRAHKVLQFVR